MVVDPGAVHSTIGTIDLDGWRSGELIQAGYTVGGGCLPICLVFRLVQLVVLSICLVDVPPNFQVELGLGCRSGARFRIRILALFPFSNDRVRGGLPWLETTGGITDDLEMAGKWWADVRRTLIGVNLSCQVSKPAGCAGFSDGDGGSLLGS